MRKTTEMFTFSAVTLLVMTSLCDALRVIDLTYQLKEGDDVAWPIYPRYNFTILTRGHNAATGITWLEYNLFSVAEHTGTHLDAPAHFAKDHWRTQQIPPSRLVGPAVVIDVTEKVKDNPDYLITVDDMMDWESQNGEIPSGGVVLMRSGWGSRYPSREQVFNTENVEEPSTFHFPGVPAYEMFEDHPDWAPSLHLGHLEVKETSKARYDRQKERASRKQFSAPAEAEEMEIATAGDAGFDSDLCGGAEPEEQQTHSTHTVQTEMTGAYIECLQGELTRLQEENRNLKDKLEKYEFSSAAFENDNDKVKYYTGLPSFAMLTVVFNMISAHLPMGNRRALSPFQMLIIALMRLRLNLPVQHIAYLFGVHRTTIATTFVETLSVMYERMMLLVRWPDRNSLRTSMPHQFVEAFGATVAVIIDCFEVFIERPSNLKARAQTFSNYKHNNTIKYLIGITPQGVISFISLGWGGRTSDKHVTENSGFLNNLLPGDKVLADRGFDIQESVGLMCAEVKIPAFTRGKCQMHAKDIEETRKLAHLRIHVERVIGNVVGKYTILSDTIPINLVLPCEGEELTFLDKMVTVCCSLTNLCPSVV